MIRLRLYTTLGCHLCEQFEALLFHLANEAPVLDRVEISEDDALVERYGVRIPVLADAAGEELDRGFEAPRLAAWLAARGWLDEAAWQQLQRELGGEPPRPARGAVIRGGRRYLG
ncbi:glutaredoxin family protein [Halomonas heilongjiangensis]|uniref:Glutaredoxin family protein n=1 Tax=Halomonas heilongjiangensis TaxID=1387883 RepID=A0A2N7TNW8_9GAMM|nr:glutaredoxin family protein [Halomonas heilongjiangensis]PMR69872.1 glutaredoxin family protein [Halomonas heilongjiangensis]PXX88019.1 thioredoxin family protein [Halomonas heilongjiangensis]